MRPGEVLAPGAGPGAARRAGGGAGMAGGAAAEFDPIRRGNLEARIARTPGEVAAAQELRYRVFYEEMTAVPSAEAARTRRDADRFDAFCDHLLVIDAGRGDIPGGVVGTYRLLRSTTAAANGGFYTSDEFDIGPVTAHPGETLELGRSCVEAAYRTRQTIQLLWQGIAQYVFRYDVGVMFGCASMQGTDPDALALPLSYLYHHHLAPPELRPRALDGRRVDMRLLAPEGIDVRRALAALPPLIKGYLRLGGFVGDGAVVDPQFDTTDISVVVKTDLVTRKYYRHYERRRPRDEKRRAGAG